MKKIFATASYALSVALLGFFVLASLRPAYLAISFYGTLAVALLASGALVFLAFSKRRPIAPEVLPALLAMSAFFAMLFVEETYLRFGISIITSLLFFVMVKQLPSAVAENYYTDLLRAIAEWSVLLVVFFTGAGLVAATVFLNFGQRPVFLVFTAVIAVLAFILFTLSPAPSLPSTLAFAAILAECFWVISLFPFSYWVSAGFLTAAAYMMMGIARGANARELKRSALNTAIVVLLLFGTARWR